MGIEEFILQRVKDEAVEKGIELEGAKKNLYFVKSLLTQTDFTVQRIAQVAEVPVAFAEEVKALLGKSSR